jgi:hypothetical protein
VKIFSIPYTIFFLFHRLPPDFKSVFINLKLKKMSKGNLISKVIPPTVVTQVLQKQSEIDALLAPYYNNVAANEKKSFPMVSEERIPFVTKGMQYITTDPAFLAPFIDVPELQRDYTLFNASRQMLIPSKQATLNIANLNTLAGSDVFVVLLVYYNSVQRASEQGNARAKVIYEDLKKAFNRKGNPKVPPTPVV